FRRAAAEARLPFAETFMTPPLGSGFGPDSTGAYHSVAGTPGCTFCRARLRGTPSWRCVGARCLVGVNLFVTEIPQFRSCYPAPMLCDIDGPEGTGRRRCPGLKQPPPATGARAN